DLDGLLAVRSGDREEPLLAEHLRECLTVTAVVVGNQNRESALGVRPGLACGSGFGDHTAHLPGSSAACPAGSDRHGPTPLRKVLGGPFLKQTGCRTAGHGPGVL